jgi:hypothetical protein
MYLSPATVAFADEIWPGIASITIDRTAVREVLAFSDGGPHPTFADCPEQRTQITVRTEVLSGVALARDVAGEPIHPVCRPGRAGLLTFTTLAGKGGRTQGSGGDCRYSCSVVLLSCTHECIGGGKRAGVVRTATFVAISPDGLADPIGVERL